MTRKKGDPNAAPIIPDEAPAKTFTPRDWTLGSLKMVVAVPLRRGSYKPKRHPFRTI